MMSKLRPPRSPDDSGSALVATIGVAMIGIALSVIVVSQAIVVTNDAARDRVRTVEIHAAEAALDSALSTLEKTTPCSTVMSVGEGAAAVDVTVAIQYFDGTSPTPLPCFGGVVTGKPIEAVVTSTAVPVNPTPGGLAPQRRMQAEVKLVPVAVDAFGAAIFSGGTVTFDNNAGVSPLDPNKRAQIWVENANFTGTTNGVYDADLIVTDGSVTLNNTSRVTGMVWAKTGMYAQNGANPFKVGGDVFVYAGNLSSQNPVKYGKTVSVNGTISGSFTANGAVCSKTAGHTPCGVLPLYTKRGLPVVNFGAAEQQEWRDAGFVIKPKDGLTNSFAADVIAGVPLTGKDATDFRANPCYFGNSTGNKPIVLTATDTVYNLSSCDFNAQNSVTFSLKADTAFFVKSFDAKNNFSVQSADGKMHKVWFIIPTNATGTKLFSLKNNTGVVPPIELFIFTPGHFEMKNNTGITGQIYGGTMNFKNNIEIKYAAMGIPGVDLGSGAAPPTEAGFSVHIVSKQELHN